MPENDNMSVKATSITTSNLLRWGGLAAMLGPLLVLVANMYNVWWMQTYGSGADGLIQATSTTAYLAFGGLRFVGGILLILGFITLYAYQVEEAGKLGVVGFVGGIVGTLLLGGLTWFTIFAAPDLAEHVPEFLGGVWTGETGSLLIIGTRVPILAQAVGWLIFGIATYRAGVFPRRAAIVLCIGALLLFVPVPGLPVVFQLAISWLGFLVFSGRVESPHSEGAVSSQSAGETA